MDQKLKFLVKYSCVLSIFVERAWILGKTKFHGCLSEAYLTLPVPTLEKERKLTSICILTLLLEVRKLPYI